MPAKISPGPGSLALDVPGDDRAGRRTAPWPLPFLSHPAIWLPHNGFPRGTQGADPAVRREEPELTITRIQDSLTGDKPSWKDLKRPIGGVYPIVWVGLILSIFQQAVGINDLLLLQRAEGGRDSKSPRHSRPVCSPHW